ncbi:MAG: hypothetical protein IJ093_04045 [Bacilli bacterium]|nr:hypothetical protein [Bacilli bacterium]
MARPSVFRSLRGSFSLTNLLNGTQRTLNIINQAIPIVKQVSPVVKNAKTMFKVMNEFKKVDMPAGKNNNSSYEEKNSVTSEEYGPTFFV